MAGGEATFSTLLARARAGDRAAGETVAKRMLEIAHGIASRRLGKQIRRRVDSLDICQVAVADAVVHLAEFTGDDEAALRRWLRGKVEQKICDQVDHHRAEMRALEREEPLPSRASAMPDAPQAARQDTPSMAAVRGETAEALRAALERLPASDRLLIDLHEQGKSWEEIAALTGAASAEAARKQRARAVRQLERMLPRGMDR